jgi:hypothetical protein
VALVALLAIATIACSDPTGQIHVVATRLAAELQSGEQTGLLGATVDGVDPSRARGLAQHRRDRRRAGYAMPCPSPGEGSRAGQGHAYREANRPI